MFIKTLCFNNTLIMTELIFLVISIILIALCGLFVAAEFSLIAVSRSTVDRLVAKGDLGAIGIKKAIDSLSTQLSGAQVGITVTNLAVGFLAEPAIASLVRPVFEAIGITGGLVNAISIFIGIALSTAATMIFGELVSKNIAIANPLRVARFIERPIRIFSRVNRLPINILNGSANIILKWFKVKTIEKLASVCSADELLSMVRHSAKKGTLDKDTATMLERSLSFGDLTAVEVMTPRVKMRSIAASASAADVIKLSVDSGLSRFPVYGKSTDDIVGFVHIKHAIKVPKNERAKTSVDKIMQPPILVPSNIQLEALLEYLRKGGLQMAVVVDEFGGTDGVVTIEDLFEELVGNVRDEYDRSPASVRKFADGSWSFSGILRQDEVSEETGILLPEEEESDTVAGLISHYLERLPKSGDVVRLNAIGRDGSELAVELKVEAMTGNSVDDVRLIVVGLAEKVEVKL